MSREEWLRFYRCPTSAIFSRTPDGWNILLDLIAEGAIVPCGADSGGHTLYVDRRHVDGVALAL
jgi:hypothetical protein